MPPGNKTYGARNVGKKNSPPMFRYYGHKKHAAKKEQKTLDASEKVRTGLIHSHCDSVVCLLGTEVSREEGEADAEGSISGG